MHLRSIGGKLRQLRRAHPSLWLPFLSGWLKRGRNGFVPCVIQDSNNLLQVPLRDFYESYVFFIEDPNGRAELNYFLNKLQPREVFYDIGGFRGAYSAIVKAKAGENIPIHIFEPLAKNAQAIRYVSELNAFDNFKINDVAVSDGNLLAVNLDEQGDMLRLGDVNARVTAQFPTTSLDDYIGAGNPPPTVIKLDVDGFEFHVLCGARKCLSQNHPRLWIEIHPEFLTAQKNSADAVLNLLRDSGYKIFLYDDFKSPNAKISYHAWCE